MIATISKEFSFSASHRLIGLPDEHPCSRHHGHNYIVRVELTGEVDGVGMVVDYGKLKPFQQHLDNTLDHRHLNDVMPVNPTAENLAITLLTCLGATVNIPDGVAVSIAVSETPRTWATVWQDK